MAAILVAEDDANIRDLVSFRLELEGHEVTAVSNGAEALVAIDRALIEIAVLDLMMPGMNGLELCQRLRTDTATMEMGIIILTARSQESDVRAGFAVGADDYVIKPFSPRELSERVLALLKRSNR